MTDSPKKVLIFTMQPPGSSGAQAYKMSKILSFMEKYGWELHFVGPDPAVASIYQEPAYRNDEFCHYTKNVAFSQYFSVKRNRIKGQSLVKIFYGACQAASMTLEKAFHFDSYKYLEKGMIGKATKAFTKYDYDLIGGICPDFKILITAYEFARLHHKPFIATYNDPHGDRKGGRFYPAEPEKQKEILGFALKAIFASPLTRDRYVEQGLVAANKAFVTYDCFPDIPDETSADTRDAQKINMVHLGNLPAYRPIDLILQAFDIFRSKQDNPRLELDFYGHVYPEAIRKIKASAGLAQTIHVHKEVTYSESHKIADRSDVLVVVIGQRHIDNVPSKFFEYLCHPKPVLVIGPKGNPVEGIVDRLGIGVYSDITQPDVILSGLISIVENYDVFKIAYTKNKDLIQEYSAERTAQRMAGILDKIN